MMKVVASSAWVIFWVWVWGLLAEYTAIFDKPTFGLPAFATIAGIIFVGLVLINSKPDAGS